MRNLLAETKVSPTCLSGYFSKDEVCCVRLYRSLELQLEALGYSVDLQ